MSLLFPSSDRLSLVIGIMVGGSVSLFVDKFRLENKEFFCSIGKDGKIVRIVECNGKAFSIFVHRKAATWIQDMYEEIVEAFQPAFFQCRFSDFSFSHYRRVGG